MEEEPMMKVTDGVREIEARRNNTTLFTHLGKAAFDHIFLHTDTEHDTNDMIVGTYIFSNNPVYEEMSDYMFQNDYPMVLNKLTVAECDMDAWSNMIARELEDDLTTGIPEEWL